MSWRSAGKLVGLVSVGVAMCVLLPGALGGDADTWSDKDREALVTLLEPLVGPQASGLEIDGVRPAALGPDCWNVSAWIMTKDAEQKRRLLVIVDCDRGLLCSLLGAPLSTFQGDTSEARLEAAEAFAREHLGPWTEHTQLVERSDKPDRPSRHFGWANVLPSGAWTGDQWNVIVNATEGAITGFFQQRAYRQVGEDEVRISEGAAKQAVVRAVARRGGDRGEEVRFQNPRLVLSHPLAPGYGPVWFVEFSIGQGERGRSVWVVDGISGDLLDWGEQQPR